MTVFKVIRREEFKGVTADKPRPWALGASWKIEPRRWGWGGNQVKDSLREERWEGQTDSSGKTKTEN